MATTESKERTMRERANGATTGMASHATSDPRLAALFEAPDLAARLAQHATSRAIALALTGLRRDAGLGLRQLAAIAGWDPGHVTRIEAGRGLVPTPATVARYARACGAEAAYVLRTPTGEVTIPFGPDLHEAAPERPLGPAADPTVAPGPPAEPVRLGRARPRSLVRAVATTGPGQAPAGPAAAGPEGRRDGQA